MTVKVTKQTVDLRDEISKALTLESLKNYKIEVKNLSSKGNIGIGIDIADPLYDNGIHLYGPNPSLKIEGSSTSAWEFIHFKQPSYERLIGMRTTGNIVINNGTNLDANNHLVVDTGGKVGIGEDSPAYDLDFGVGKTIRLRHQADGTAIRVGASDYDVNLIRFDGATGITDGSYYGGSLRYMGTRSANNNSLAIFMDNSLGTEVEALTVLQNGNIGIGEIVPKAKLQINSTTGTSKISEDANLMLLETSGAATAGVGSQISFSYDWNNSGTYLSGAPFIRSHKEASNNTDYNSALQLGIRKNGVADPEVALHITSDKAVGIGNGSAISQIEAISGRLTIGQNTASDQNDYGVTILKKGTNASPGTWDHTKGAIQINDVVGQGPSSYSNIGILFNAGLGRLANGDSNTHLGSLIHISYDSGPSPLYMDARGNTWFGYNRAAQTTDSVNVNSVKVAGDLYVGNGDSDGTGNGSNTATVRMVMGQANSNSRILQRVNGGGAVYAGIDEVNSPNNEFRAGHLNGTNRYEISVNNNDAFANGVVLSAGGTSWGTFSDERKKTDLAPIENGLEKVATLRAVTGRYTHDSEDISRSFLIAQDVEKVLPQAVGSQTASMDDDTEYLTLNYTETIPLLVAALKDAKDRIEALEAEVQALKGE